MTDEAKVLYLRAKPDIFAVHGDDAVSEDGLYERIVEACSGDDERFLDEAMAALWPPEEFPVGFRAEFRLPHVVLTCSIELDADL